MKKLLLFIAILFAASHARATQPAGSAYDRMMRTGTLRCGYGIWPPFFEVDVNTGKLKGLVKDMSDGIANILGIKIEYVPVVIGPSSLQDLRTGKVDAICGDGPWILAGIKNLNYTNSYLYAQVRVYSRANETRFATLSQLDKPDVTFIGIDGDSSSDLVLRNYPHAKLRTLPGTADPSQMFMDVVSGKADLFLTDPLTAALFMKNNPGKIKQVFEETPAVYGAGFSVAKGETELLITLNEAIKAAIDTGLVASVLKKYDPDGKSFLLPATPYEHKETP